MIKKDIFSFPSWIHNSSPRRTNLWNYIDTRDIASACELAITKDNLGFVVLNLAADDNSQDALSLDLLKAEFPNVTDIRGNVQGYETLYSNKKAKEVLGWTPVHFWRDHVPKQ